MFSPRAAEMTPTIARIFMNVNDLRAKMRDEQERLQDQEIQVSSKLDELRASKNRAEVSQNEYKEFKRIYFHKYGEMKEKELLRQLKQVRSRVPEPDNARQGNSINVEVYSGWLERFKDELNAKYDQLKANVDEDRENIDSDIHMQAKQYEELKVVSIISVVDLFETLESHRSQRKGARKIRKRVRG